MNAMGIMAINFDMTEIFKLALGLKERNIPYQIRAFNNGLQICFGAGDVICNRGSYGHERGLLETMGFSWDGYDFTGYLTADEILEKIDNGD